MAEALEATEVTAFENLRQRIHNDHKSEPVAEALEANEYATEQKQNISVLESIERTSFNYLVLSGGI